MDSTRILGFLFYSAWQNRQGLRIGTYSILVYFVLDCFNFQNECDFEFRGFLIPLEERAGYKRSWLSTEGYAILGTRFYFCVFRRGD